MNLGNWGRPDHAFAAHEIGRGDLGITVMFGVEIEQVVDQRALEPGALPAKNDKAAAGNFRGRLEINQTKLRADIPMRLRFEIKLRRLADDSFDAIIGRAGTDRDRLVDDVGNAQEKIILLGFDRGEFLVQPADLFAQLFRLGGFLRHVFTLRLECANFLAGAIPFVLQRLAFLQALAALLVQKQELADGLFVPRISKGEPFPVIVGIFANLADVQHRWEYPGNPTKAQAFGTALTKI